MRSVTSNKDVQAYLYCVFQSPWHLLITVPGPSWNPHPVSQLMAVREPVYFKLFFCSLFLLFFVLPSIFACVNQARQQVMGARNSPCIPMVSARRDLSASKLRFGHVSWTFSFHFMIYICLSLLCWFSLGVMCRRGTPSFLWRTLLTNIGALA